MSLTVNEIPMPFIVKEMNSPLKENKISSQNISPNNKNNIPLYPTKQHQFLCTPSKGRISTQQQNFSDKSLQKQRDQSKENAQKHLANLQNRNIDISRNYNKAVLPLPQFIFLPQSHQKTELSYVEKARMIREINLKIQLLEAKAKQPNIQIDDLFPLREEIYDKFDHYYISNKQSRLKPNDNTKNQINYQKNTALPSNIRRDSRQLSINHMKVDCKLSIHQSPPSKQSQKSISKPHSSKHKEFYNNLETGTVNIRSYKTLNNLSIGSRSHRSNNEQSHPVFETHLSEQDLAGLDRSAERKMSEFSNQHHDSYLELKQNVRIMEERIGFLIIRLEQNKRQMGLMKQYKQKIEKSMASIEQQCDKYKIANQELMLSNQQIKVENKTLEQRIKDLNKENSTFEKVAAKYEKKVTEMTSDLQYLTKTLIFKENELHLMEQQLTCKKVENQEYYRNLQCLERDYALKRAQLIDEIGEKEKEIQELKTQLKQCKSRMEIEGINFKFQEAAKLQKYIEENESLHQRQIEKIDKCYSQTIKNYEVENRKMKNQKVELQNALIEWIQSYKQFNPGTKGQTFDSPLIKLEAIELKVGGHTANDICNQFISIAKINKQLQKQIEQQIALNRHLDSKISILQEEYQSIISKKLSENEDLESQLRQQMNLSKIYREDKLELIEQNIKIKEYCLRNHSVSIIKSTVNVKLQSKNIQYSYPEPEFTLQVDLTLQQMIDKSLNLSTKKKFMIGLKLINLGLSLQGSKKKLPSLNPSSLVVNFNDARNFDFDVCFCQNPKEQQQNLHYCAPQVLLGFNQTNSSYCWTIGIIIDKLLHGKQYFKKFDEILSRKENYVIRDQKYKGVQVLIQMLRKNQKQRVNLQYAKERIQKYLQIAQL